MNQSGTYINIEVPDIHDPKKAKSTKEFVECVIRLLSLPFTEANVERIFSFLNYLFPPSRYKPKDDLMEAQMIIRINYTFKNGGLKKKIYYLT